MIRAKPEDILACAVRCLAGSGSRSESFSVTPSPSSLPRSAAPLPLEDRFKHVMAWHGMVRIHVHACRQSRASSPASVFLPAFLPAFLPTRPLSQRGAKTISRASMQAPKKSCLV